MRVIAALALIASLSACGEPDQLAARASEPEVLMGRFKAASDTARQVTGDVVIERGGLVFGSGAILYTRVLNPRRGSDLVARGGDSYAAIALGAAELTVELRRVTEQRLNDGAEGLCGEARPAYAALVHERPAAAVTVLVFEGEEAPGPEATDSRLCAAYSYSAPDGARTRQGVLLH